MSNLLSRIGEMFAKKPTAVRTVTHEMKQFSENSAIYARIADRYTLYMTIIVWEMNEPKAIKAKMGAAAFEKMKADVSNCLVHVMRLEDILFAPEDSDEQVLRISLVLANDARSDSVIIARALDNVRRVAPDVSFTIRAGTALPGETPEDLLRRVLASKPKQ